MILPIFYKTSDSCRHTAEMYTCTQVLARIRAPLNRDSQSARKSQDAFARGCDFTWLWLKIPWHSVPEFSNLKTGPLNTLFAKTCGTEWNVSDGRKCSRIIRHPWSPSILHVSDVLVNACASWIRDYNELAGTTRDFWRYISISFPLTSRSR